MRFKKRITSRTVKSSNNNLPLTSKPCIPLSTAGIIRAEIGMMCLIVAAPPLVAVREHHGAIVAAIISNDDHMGQVAVEVEALGDGIEGGLLHLANGGVVGVEHEDVELVVGADAILIALVLHHMHGAPPGREPGRLYRRVAVQSEALLAQHWHPAQPAQLLRAWASVFPPAQVARFFLLRPFAHLRHVQRLPVIHGCQLQDWCVQPVFRISVYPARFGEGDGEVADVVIVEELPACFETGSWFRKMDGGGWFQRGWECLPPT